MLPHQHTAPSPAFPSRRITSPLHIPTHLSPLQTPIFHSPGSVVDSITSNFHPQDLLSDLHPAYTTLTAQTSHLHSDSSLPDLPALPCEPPLHVCPFPPDLLKVLTPRLYPISHSPGTNFRHPDRRSQALQHVGRQQSRSTISASRDRAGLSAPTAATTSCIANSTLRQAPGYLPRRYSHHLRFLLESRPSCRQLHLGLAAHEWSALPR